MKWILRALLLSLAIGEIRSDECAKKYHLKNCSCELDDSEPDRLIYSCQGWSFPDTVSRLPSPTVHLNYLAEEKDILFGAANFTHLSKLTYLRIAPAGRRDIQLILLPNETNVLKPLINLGHLAINVVWELSFPMPEFLQPLVSLWKLDLSYTKKVNISSLASMLYGLQNSTEFIILTLKNIQTLEFASTMGQTEINLSTLLHPIRFTKLDSLDLSYNAIQFVHPGLNMYAKYLQTLHFENNMMIHLFKSSFIIDIITHPSLFTVNLEYQGFGQFRYFDLTPSIMYTDKQDDISQHSTPLPYREFVPHNHLDRRGGNCIQSLKQDLCTVFEDVCKETRKYIMESNSTCNLTKSIFPSLFTGIPCEVIPHLREMLAADCSGCFVVPTTGSVSGIYMNDLNIYDDVYTSSTWETWWKTPTCFHERNQITVMDVSGNWYAHMVNIIPTSVKGLRRMKGLYLRNIGLENVGASLGKDFPGLVGLDLSQNHLNFEIQSNVFEGMSSLSDLNLFSNEITRLPKYIFNDLEDLNSLNLSYNNLKEFEVDLGNCSRLLHLDLKNNELETIPVSVTEALDILAFRSGHFNIEIYLANNNFLCICDNRDFIEWILFRAPSKIKIMDKDDILCTNRYLKVVQISKLTSFDLRDMCRGEHFYIFLSVGISVGTSFLFFGCCIFIYKKRWWFRYQVFLTRRIWKKYHARTDLERNYEYDVFISYNDRDHFWVDDVLRPKLEDEHGIRLCLHLRDFMFGEMITDQIIESIENSRHTLLILSPNFLASTWCHFEMRMAQHKLFSGEDVLLLALLKPLPKVGVSKLLKSIMETKTYIEWTEDEDGQRLFWAKLVQAVKEPAEEPFDVSIEHVEEDAALFQ